MFTSFQHHSFSIPLAALQTAHGTWSPRAWLWVFLCGVFVALWIRALGRRDAARGGEARKPFVSGNDVADPEAARVSASHMYWGFLTALRPYYRRLLAFHAGLLPDYILWFLAAVAVWFLLPGGTP